MRLQLALDGTFAEARRVLTATQLFVDLVEVGTPLIYREGVQALARLRREFPTMRFLADLKIMDAGEEEATLAFEAGASAVTVLGLAHDQTVRGTVSAARRVHGQVWADLMRVRDPVGRGRELIALGVDGLCVHTAVDAHATDGAGGALSHLTALREALPQASLAIAGGIGPDTINAVATLRPSIVVIGGAITRADDPAAAAKHLRQFIQTL